MIKKIPYDELAAIIANRSTCNVRVGAIIYDKHGVFSWGWNNAGPNGLGEHAEEMAIRRANRKRLRNAHIVVVAFRKKNQITSVPCINCSVKIAKAGLKFVTCALPSGEWTKIKL